MKIMVVAITKLEGMIEFSELTERLICASGRVIPDSGARNRKFTCRLELLGSRVSVCTHSVAICVSPPPTPFISLPFYQNVLADLYMCAGLGGLEGVGGGCGSKPFYLLTILSQHSELDSARCLLLITP